MARRFPSSCCWSNRRLSPEGPDMPILRTLVASFVMLGLCLLTAMTGGCATTAPAAERAPASANHYNAVPAPTADAQRIYQAANAQGYVASLLIQDRPSAFTQSVANIEPGKQIDINIKYVHQLDYADGWYEFHFPMVMKSKVTPEQRSGRDISLK